jgi:hypothetical protein
MRRHHPDGFESQLPRISRNPFNAPMLQACLLISTLPAVQRLSSTLVMKSVVGNRPHPS